MWPLFAAFSGVFRRRSSTACSGQQATPEVQASSVPWPPWYCQDSHSSARLPFGCGLFVRCGGLAVTSSSILPHGLPNAVESTIFVVRNYRIARRLAQVCKLPLCLWLSVPLAVLFGARSPVPRHISFARESFLFVRVWRLFATVPLRLTASRAFSGVGRFLLYTGTCAVAC